MSNWWLAFLLDMEAVLADSGAGKLNKHYKPFKDHVPRMRRRSYPRRSYPSSRWGRKKKKDVKKRMLRMRNRDLFIWDLNKILQGVTDQRHAEILSATIYSKASRMGIDEALGYTVAMVAEEALDEETAGQIRELLLRNTMRR